MKFPSLIHIDYSTNKHEFSNGKIFYSEKEAKNYQKEIIKEYLSEIRNPIVHRLAQEILEHRKDYLNYINDVVQNCNIPKLREVLLECQFRSECIYQAFTFKNEIKEYYYSGHIFGSLGTKPTLKDSAECILDIIEANDFMEGLVKHFFELLEDGNYYYDLWEFDTNKFSIFFGIHKSVYKQKMEGIKQWFIKEKIQHLVEYEQNYKT
jgi:hypothetical protein